MSEKEEIVQIKYQGQLFVVGRYDLILSDWWFQFPGDSSAMRLSHRLYEKPFDDGYYHVCETISPCQVVRK